MRLTRSTLVLAATTLLAACGGSGTTSPTSGFEGTWVAVSVGGKTLPAHSLEFPASAAYDSVPSRTLTVSPGGDFGSWTDSTYTIFSGLHQTIFIGGGGILTWTSTGSVVHMQRKLPACLCWGAMFFTMDFTLQSDGTLTAHIDASDGPLTTFRRQ